MATVTKPIALDESFNTTEQTPRNIADVLAEGLSHITGRTASDVEYDNTDSGLISDDVQGAIDELSERPTLPTTEEQTAVDEFSTYNGGLLSSCKVALSPNQDLHGYDSPWVGGASDNLLPLTVDGIKALNTDGTWNGNVYTWRGITYTILTDDGNNVIGINSNGTASERGWLFLAEKHFDDNDVTFGGSVYASATNYSYYCGFTNQDAYIYYNSLSNKSYILIANGYTTNNQKWYPIVRTKTTEAPVFSPYSNICPISGHTQVEVDNHQKNLFNPSNVLNAFFFGGYNITDEPQTRTIYAQCKPNTVYTVSKTAGQRFCVGYTKELPANGVVVYDKTSDNTASSITITTGADAKYIVGYVHHAQHDSITADEMLASCQIELGSTATAYVPYNGYQVTVNLGGTYYSGTLDVVSGVFTPDTASVDLGTLTWTKDSSKTFYAFITDSLTGLQDMWCEVLDPYPENYRLNNYDNYPDNIIARNTTQKNVYVKCTTYEDGTASDFKTAMSGYKLVYELATPTPIQLSPTMVKALVGENHLSAPLEGQEITESKYRELFTWDEVEEYVNAHSGGGSGMNYSTNEQVVGTWIDGKPLYQKTVDQTIGSDADYAVFANGIAHAHLVNSCFEYSSGRWFSSGYTSIGITSNSRTCYVEVQNGALNLHNQSNSSIHWIATIQYTKTSD